MAIEISNEDNMELMARYPNKYFELAIVDPPYGIGESNKNRSSKPRTTKPNKNGRVVKVKAKDTSIKSWDNKPPSKHYFEELIRVSKNQIIWGANHFISNIPYDSPCWVVWDKINGDTDFADCELAWTSFKSSVRQIRYMWNGFNQSQNLKNPELPHGNHKIKEQRIHPTQKPVDLYKWLLDKYAKPGDKILDTHIGSGSIAIAAHDYGFDLVGCELDTDYYNATMKRISQHTAQTTLF